MTIITFFWDFQFLSPKKIFFKKKREECPETVQVNIFWHIIKAPAKEQTLLRKRFPEMLPRWANEETFGEEAKCCWKNSETVLLPQQMFPEATNGETFACATMFPLLRWRLLLPSGYSIYIASVGCTPANQKKRTTALDRSAQNGVISTWA